MITNEFLSLIKSRGAKFTTPATIHDITRTNAILQSRRRAIIPSFLSEILLQTNGINLGNGYIFGTNEFPQGLRQPAPSIINVADDTSSLPQLKDMTIFGRNDLFWFGYDAFGICYMLDNLTLRPLRRYDDAIKSLTDCLISS